MPEVETKKGCVNKGSYVTQKLKSIFFIPNLLKSHGFMATPCPWIKYITFTSYYTHYVYFDNFWVQFPTKAPDGYAPPKLSAVLFLLSAQSIPPPGETQGRTLCLQMLVERLYIGSALNLSDSNTSSKQFMDKTRYQFHDVSGSAKHTCSNTAFC